ncbi:hypothetical protein CC86DRAFT_426434 [Ophiobolus disseminans]|uniref:Uncharacterized protein n=1 Tax=Ophiobolus disseminans TaxID=1469910 RepID=A0A6A6ZLR0_9PLEO|nr:hypothetical protein CC86DRAFT_426434 [Ophiobolus disseminans]
MPNTGVARCTMEGMERPRVAFQGRVAGRAQNKFATCEDGSESLWAQAECDGADGPIVCLCATRRVASSMMPISPYYSHTHLPGPQQQANLSAAPIQGGAWFRRHGSAIVQVREAGTISGCHDALGLSPECLFRDMTAGDVDAQRALLASRFGRTLTGAGGQWAARRWSARVVQLHNGRLAAVRTRVWRGADIGCGRGRTVAALDAGDAIARRHHGWRRARASGAAAASKTLLPICFLSCSDSPAPPPLAVACSTAQYTSSSFTTHHPSHSYAATGADCTDACNPPAAGDP